MASVYPPHGRIEAIRQSTACQVSSNTESTLRQYALRDRLAALGWEASLIHTIDSGLGFSGKSSDTREGFQQLMSDVANGPVGAIACIEPQTGRARWYIGFLSWT